MKIKTWRPHWRNKWLDLAPVPVLFVIMGGVVYSMMTQTKIPETAIYIALPIFMVCWLGPLFFRKFEIVEIDTPDQIEVSRFYYRDENHNRVYVQTPDTVVCKIVAVSRDSDAS